MDITELLEFSVKHNASDLHLSAGVPPMVRVDGDVRKLSLPALDNEAVNQLIFDVMTDTQQRDFEQHLEVDFAFEMPSIGRFRVNAYHQSRGCAAVFRTIPSEVPSLESIGAPDIFEKFTRYQKGLVLVTGPTGSGKSTTLAAIIDRINTEQNRHVLTIEDPIEFVHQQKKCLVNQREIHKDTHSFHNALRSALREDPDVIMVGELRDKETISLALTAAETGHLVFASLHTSSAAKTIDRIIDVFPGTDKPMVRSMLSESLRAVVSQKLVKHVSGGRIAAYEVMIATSAVRNLIREDKIAQMYSTIQTGSSQGMLSMEQSLRELMLQGLIDPAEAQKAMDSAGVPM